MSPADPLLTLTDWSPELCRELSEAWRTGAQLSESQRKLLRDVFELGLVRVLPEASRQVGAADVEAMYAVARSELELRIEEPSRRRSLPGDDLVEIFEAQVGDLVVFEGDDPDWPEPPLSFPAFKGLQWWGEQALWRIRPASELDDTQAELAAEAASKAWRRRLLRSLFEGVLPEGRPIALLRGILANCSGEVQRSTVRVEMHARETARRARQEGPAPLDEPGADAIPGDPAAANDPQASTLVAFNLAALRAMPDLRRDDGRPRFRGERRELLRRWTRGAAIYLSGDVDHSYGAAFWRALTRTEGEARTFQLRRLVRATQRAGIDCPAPDTLRRRFTDFLDAFDQALQQQVDKYAQQHPGAASVAALVLGVSLERLAASLSRVPVATAVTATASGAATTAGGGVVAGLGFAKTGAGLAGIALAVLALFAWCQPEPHGPVATDEVVNGEPRDTATPREVVEPPTGLALGLLPPGVEGEVGLMLRGSQRWLYVADALNRPARDGSVPADRVWCYAKWWRPKPSSLDATVSCFGSLDRCGVRALDDGIDAPDPCVSIDLAMAGEPASLRCDPSTIRPANRSPGEQRRGCAWFSTWCSVSNPEDDWAVVELAAGRGVHRLRFPVRGRGTDGLFGFELPGSEPLDQRNKALSMPPAILPPQTTVDVDVHALICDPAERDAELMYRTWSDGEPGDWGTEQIQWPPLPPPADP